MIVHEDKLKSFIPNTQVKFVILGTMLAINGRTIDGAEPTAQYFYYNNNRNHFWRVLQYLVDPNLQNGEHIPKFTIKEKKDFLNTHGIAICNIVKKVKVAKKYESDPSDTVLFEAYKKKRIEFKTLSPKLKKILKTTPLFFTCRKKKGIEQLLDGFFKENQLEVSLKNNIWYWATPTRCNPYKRSLCWRAEMKEFYDARSK